jgi:hypothetical protein
MEQSSARFRFLPHERSETHPMQLFRHANSEEMLFVESQVERERERERERAERESREREQRD